MASRDQGNHNGGGTRQALVDSAMRLFASQGFESTSVQEIVDGANLTKGAFYHYFKAKEDILRVVHDDMLDSLLARTEAVLELELDPPETLARLLEAILLSYEHEENGFAVFLRAWRSLNAKAFEEVRVRRDHFERTIIEVVEKGIASGQFRPIAHHRLAVFGIIGMATWANEWFDPKGKVTTRELADLYTDLVLNGLAQKND